jgi:hypothetical protein
VFGVQGALIKHKANAASIYGPETRSHCVRHDTDCPCCLIAMPDIASSALSVGAAGSTCTGFSSQTQGLNGGCGHSESMIPFCHWAAEMSFLAPDVLLHECATNFPPELLEVFFDSNRWDIHSLGPLSPHMLGWPVNRPRRFTVLFNKLTVESTFRMQTFLDLFRRQVVLSGDVFFVASDTLLSREVHRLAKRRKCSPALADHPRFDWAVLYAPSADRILKDHTAHREKNNLLDEPYLCDLDQNKGTSSKAGHYIPSMLRHGHVYSFSKKRHMVEEEQFLAHGFPVMDACGTKWQPPWTESLFSDEFTEIDRKSLVGNSMHLGVVTAVLGYIFATTRKHNEQTTIFSSSTVFDDLDGESGCDC